MTKHLLFTHRGLSGPAVLQISSYWQDGTPLSIHLAPGVDWPAVLAQAKARSRKLIANELAQWVPSRLADAWSRARRRLAAPHRRSLRQSPGAAGRTPGPLGDHAHRHRGLQKAEVTLGGIDTRALSSQTMEARQQPGLYFIGEVVDVTGWLGGYNFQWAWSQRCSPVRKRWRRLRLDGRSTNAIMLGFAGIAPSAKY